MSVKKPDPQAAPDAAPGRGPGGTATARVMTVSDDLPIRGARPVHSGKVRSVYWLDPEDSARIVAARGYAIAPDSQLAVMVISDRVSAFDCLWRAESLPGVPGKGAALNAIAEHCFRCVTEAGLGAHHLLEAPHPMLWIVRQARPLMIEAIARRYLTGSLWRAYEQGERQFGGQRLPDGMQRHERLRDLLLTPTTKGLLRGIDGIAERDDTALSPAQLAGHWAALGFREAGDIDRVERAVQAGFELLTREYARHGELLVDTKFEFGYAPALGGGEELLFMDEIGTPDSSRVWREAEWRRGTPREYSKEFLRAALLARVPEPELLLDPLRMEERREFAASHALPDELFESLSALYTQSASRLLESPFVAPERPREALVELLHERYGLVP